MPRVRTISMNFYLGGFAGQNINNAMQLYFKLSDLNASSPTPTKTFLFLDEREDVINWGNFATVMNGYSPPNPALFEFDQDLPAFYHNRACGLSFCDGHSEIKKWLDPRTMPPLQIGVYIIQTWPTPRDVDVAWLQDHTTRPK
jgi:prepilin-type processing-associated H-X9-DG protein